MRIARYWNNSGWTLRSGIHKLVNSVLNKDEKPRQWNKSSTVTVYQNGNKTDTDFSNYSETSVS
jgi:hypothetical protein